MKTYGDIYNEFCDKFPTAEAVDWRPAIKLYIPQLSKDIPNAIIIWLNDGTKVIYGAEVGVISEISKNYDLEVYKENEKKNHKGEARRWKGRYLKLKREIEVVTHGNCMLCGKELTDGLFICKECASHIKANEESEVSK